MPHLTIRALVTLSIVALPAPAFAKGTKAPPGLEAQLAPKNGSTVKGKVQITETPQGLNLQYKISGLQKSSTHGFHIHEKGDCSSNDGKSAGPHYMKIAEGGGTSSDNPDRYAGDMPEIKADAKGEAEGTVMLHHGGLSKTSDILNRAIIVHAGPDDVKKPSSKRVACGVIQNPKM